MAISAVLYTYRPVIFHLTPLLEQIHRSRPITRKQVGILRSSYAADNKHMLIVSKLFGQDSHVYGRGIFPLFSSSSIPGI
jgi:hypothetical protein